MQLKAHNNKKEERLELVMKDYVVVVTDIRKYKNQNKKQSRNNFFF